MDKISMFLSNLPRVLNDDGGFGSPPTELVIQNSIKFVKSLPAYYQRILDLEDCITATGHGTVTIDWYYKKHFISVEIGNTLIGWFSDLPDGINTSSSGVPINDSPPTEIISGLNKIYSRKEV